MDDSYLLALGFEVWESARRWQTTVYIHRNAARDGARLYMSVPRSAHTQPDATEQQRLAESIAAFFHRHGGAVPAAAPVLDMVC
ncbi:hypothetical protein [Hymenobacter sp. B81]|uniref:hypothetical protein n=1 Tax=Hymenobacter sp. B81 TaxID=3344878 RepID=UPI0037DC393D